MISEKKIAYLPLRALTKVYDRLQLAISRVYQDWAESRFLAKLPAADSLTSVEQTDKLGRGVFATTTIPPATLIGIYPGHKRCHSEFYEKQDFVEPSLRYAYYLSDSTVIDPSDLFGQVPNHSHLRLALINEPPPGAAVNVVPISSTHHVWYLTLRNIAPGEQLFTTYGPQFIRNYSTEMTSTGGLVPLSAVDCQILQQAAISYSWLRCGIEEFQVGTMTTSAKI